MLALVAATERELRACLGEAWPEQSGAEPLSSGAPEGVVLEQGRMTPLTLHGRDVLACVCGVGLVNAATVLGRLLERGVEGVVNAGVAGSFDTRTAPLGSAWLAKSEAWPEYGLLDGSPVADARALKFPLARVDGLSVWDRVELDPRRDAASLGLDPSGTPGVADFLSVSGVSADTGRADALRKRFDVLLENMEGFALALGCVAHGVPFVELRTVSNPVGSRKRADWNIEGALAALGNACTDLLSGRRKGSPLS